MSIHPYCHGAELPEKETEKKKKKKRCPKSPVELNTMKIDTQPHNRLRLKTQVEKLLTW